MNAPAPPPSDPTRVERLARHAERWNTHPSLTAYGVRLSYPDAARVRIEVDQIAPSMRGGLGDDAVVNGGVLSGLCDLIIGSTSGLVDTSVRAATMQLSIRFERPLRGDRIVGEARVDHHTGRTIFASAEISDAAGVVCVRCQGIVALLQKKS